MDSGRASVSSCEAMLMRGERGFTLLELLVTLLLAVLITSLVVPEFRKSVAGMQLRRESREVGAFLKQARGRAITRASVVELVIDPESHTISAAPDDPQYRTDETVELLLPDPGMPSGSRLRIVFYPDGSSSGGAFVLATGGKSYEISVDWMTGRIGVT